VYLTKYVEQEGHAKVPRSYKTADGYRLGQWVGWLRSNRGRLTSEQELSLELLNGWVWDTLKATWEEGFSHLTKYVDQEGHARVPNSYSTEDGYKLGGWVSKQRGKRDKLKLESVSRLESLNGWIWAFRKESIKIAWEEGFSHLTKYVDQEGHARVPSSYETEGSYRLGQWVSNQRSNRDKLASKQVSRLELLDGWVWDVLDASWENGFSYLTKYVDQEGHAKVPKSYSTEDGYKLGGWVSSQRSNRDKLNLERKSKLDLLDGWVWDILDAAWEEGFSYLSKYVEHEGHAQVPNSYKAENGYQLGQWVSKQRDKRDKLTPERKSKLESLDGWVWNTLNASWEQGFSYLTKYVEKKGDAKVLTSYTTDGGYRLGQWVGWQRRNRNNLTSERESRLESLGFVWKI